MKLTITKLPFLTFLIQINKFYGKNINKTFYFDFKSQSEISLVISIGLITNEISLVDFSTNKTLVLMNEISDWLDYDDDYDLSIGIMSTSSISQSIMGCVSSFGVWDGIKLFDLNKQISLVQPKDSIAIGVCKDVDVCTDTICNGGVCSLLGDGYNIQCDCNNVPRDPQTGLLLSGRYCKTLLYRYTQCPSLTKLNCLNSGGNCRQSPLTGQYYCQCKQNYYGENCNITKTTRSSITVQCKRCEAVKGAVCTLYDLPKQLCEAEQLCKWKTNLVTNYNQRNSFKCLCDETFYRGTYCDEEEIGFYPATTGAIIMGQYGQNVSNHNYLRILFESRNLTTTSNLVHEIQTLVTIQFPIISDLQIILVNNTLKLIMNGKLIFNGNTTKLNVLLLLFTSNGLSLNLNGLTDYIPIANLQITNQIREKRSTSSSNKLIVGCDLKFENCFRGLIAGVKWNENDIREPSNKIYRGGIYLPIKNLETHKFPSAVYKSDRAIPWVLIICLVTLFVVIITILAAVIFFNLYKFKLTSDGSIKINEQKFITKNPDNYSKKNNYIPILPLMNPNFENRMLNSQTQTMKSSYVDSPNATEITELINADTIESQQCIPLSMFPELRDGELTEKTTPTIDIPCNLIRQLVVLEKECFDLLNGYQIGDMKPIPNTNKYLVLIDGELLNSEDILILHTSKSNHEICERIFFNINMEYICADIKLNNKNESIYTLKIWKIEQATPQFITSPTLSTVQYTHSSILIGSTISIPTNHIALYNYYNCSISICDLTNHSVIKTININQPIINEPIKSIHLSTHQKNNQLNFILLLDNSDLSSINSNIFYSINNTIYPLNQLTNESESCSQVVPIVNNAFFLLLTNGNLMELNLINEQAQIRIIKENVVKLCMSEYGNIRKIAIMLKNKVVLVLLDVSVLSNEENESMYPWITLSPRIIREDILAEDCLIGFSWNCQHLYRIYNGNQLHLWNLQTGSNICRFYRLKKRINTELNNNQTTIINMSPDCHYLAAVVANEITTSIGDSLLSNYVTVGSIDTIYLTKNENEF